MTIKQLIGSELKIFSWGYAIYYPCKNLVSMLSYNKSAIVRVSNGIYDNCVLNSNGKAIYQKTHLEKNI